MSNRRAGDNNRTGVLSLVGLEATVTLQAAVITREAIGDRRSADNQLALVAFLKVTAVTENFPIVTNLAPSDVTTHQLGTGVVLDIVSLITSRRTVGRTVEAHLAVQNILAGYFVATSTVEVITAVAVCRHATFLAVRDWATGNLLAGITVVSIVVGIATYASIATFLAVRDWATGDGLLTFGTDGLIAAVTFEATIITAYAVRNDGVTDKTRIRHALVATLFVASVAFDTAVATLFAVCNRRTGTRIGTARRIELKAATSTAAVASRHTRTGRFIEDHTNIGPPGGNL